MVLGRARAHVDGRSEGQPLAVIGACPFSRRSGNLRGIVDRTSVAWAAVTVAGLCRISTGFAIERVSMSCPVGA
jgi:hypothetical protein